MCYWKIFIVGVATVALFMKAFAIDSFPFYFCMYINLTVAMKMKEANTKPYQSAYICG